MTSGVFYPTTLTLKDMIKTTKNSQMTNQRRITNNLGEEITFSSRTKDDAERSLQRYFHREECNRNIRY
jgi:hypothetical protein